MSLTLRFRLWTAAVALLGAVFVFDALPHFGFETNILALLPPNETDAAADRALDRFSDLLGRNFVYLIGAADFARAKLAAQGFAARLRASPAFATTRLEVDADYLRAFTASYAPYRGGLLSDRMRAWLEAGDDAALLNAAQQALYSPAAFLRRSGAGDDPLNLFGDFLAQVTPAGGRLELRDGMLTITTATPAMHYVMVSGVLAGDAFSTHEEDLARPVLTAARAVAEAGGASVNGAGLIEHAIAASGLAKHEIDLFGSVQVAGLLLVLWWVFRSLRVLWLSAATLAVGVIAGLAATHYVFGKVQVLALVFCSNLAGVAIDYSIYFCADQFRMPGRWTAAQASRHIGPAIGMSCAAAVLSYALLAVAPFPGLRQGALFCCVGLMAAYACVAAWFPRWVRPSPTAPALRIAAVFARFLDWRERIAGARMRRWWWLLPMFIGGGLLQLRFSDDVRSLQPDTPALTAQEVRVRDLLGNIPESLFFLVRGSDPQTLLEHEEALRERIDPLIASQALSGYTAISTALPSLARQSDNRQLLTARVYGAGGDGSGLLDRFMRQLGFDGAAIAAHKQVFTKSEPLTPEVWLATPAADGYRHLWLGDIGRSQPGVQAPTQNRYASVVTLDAVHDVAPLRAAAANLPGVRLVERLAEISTVLKRYRERAMVLVALASVASALLLAIGYGLRRGVALMVTPVAACLATLAVFGYAGIAVSFFNIVALHLVMGLGMEYAILLMIAELGSVAVLVSATLAAALALLAFGLLGLSATPFIHSLGSTVTIGVLFGFAFAWLAGTLAPTKGTKGAHEPVTAG